MLCALNRKIMRIGGHIIMDCDDIYYHCMCNRLEYLRRNSAKESKEIRVMEAEKRRRESQQ